jgi:hypothetical protein
MAELGEGPPPMQAPIALPPPDIQPAPPKPAPPIPPPPISVSMSTISNYIA